MDGTVFRDLISNVALLLSMSVIYEARYAVPQKYGKYLPYLNGILISLLCIGIMSLPFELMPGLFFDTRTILIGVTATVFGGVATGVAVCVTVAYRFLLGGVGVWMGVLTIISSAAIGLIYRRIYLRRPFKRIWLSTYLLGLCIHAAMLLCTLALPWPLMLRTLSKIALPVMLIFPFGTMMLGMLLLWQRERHEASLLVAEAEERYRSLFEGSNAVMMIIDPESGRIIDANAAAAAFYGWQRVKLQRMSISEINTLSRDEIFTKMRQSTASVRNYFLFSHRKADGETVDVEVYSGPITIGGKTHLYSIVHDITSRTAAERKLKESEDRLKSAQTMAHVGNWELDLASDTVWASEECFSIYGVAYGGESKRLPIAKIKAATYEADQPAFSKAMDALVKQNEPYDMEFRILRPDGQTRHVHSMARLESRPDGKPVKVVGVLQDVTGRKLARQEINRNEAKQRAMIANIADVIAVMAPDGTVRYCSPNIKKWFGWELEDVVGTVSWNLVHPEDHPRLMDGLNDILASDGAMRTEQCRLLNKDGDYRIIEITAINLVNDPVIGGVLMNYRDVTERATAQMEYRALLQAAMDGFCIVNHLGEPIEMNDAYCKLTGYTREELARMPITAIEVNETGQSAAAHIEKAMREGSGRFETRLRHKGGGIIDVDISCNAAPGNVGRICVFMRDITERKRHEDEVEYLSLHDSLTGVYNRAYYESELRREDASGRLPLSVIMGDINGLKLTNDIFGHTDGDKLLRAIAAILRSCCRAGDVITRVGGDEFSILLPQTSMDEAQALCEEIYRVCEESEISVGGRPVHPSISLGCATKISGEQPIETVMKDAEDSMYKRKLLERKSQHSSLVASIKAAMLEKSHETTEHAERLIHLCKQVGRNMNFGNDQLNELELLAALHDIGKIGIDDRILTSRNKLSDDEWLEMRKHPEIGYRIALASPELVPIANCILSHHERWDGAGYPQKLKGDKIPLLARIISVVDSYDAMTSDRPYRNAMPKEDALREIETNAGGQFDPEVARVFLDIMDERTDMFYGYKY